jgi:arylsulfatase A-like enzyme
VGLDEPHRNNRARPEIGIDSRSRLFSKTRFYDPERLDWRYTAPPPFLPDLPEIRKDMESFRVGVGIMDDYMGRALFALEQHGLAQDTLVMVTTDHGIEFPGGKMTLTDQGTGVMLMVRGPGGFAGGRVIESLVSHLDIYPTLCELLGIVAPAGLRGYSLLPLVRGETAAVRDHVATEQTWHGNRLDPLRAIRTERHKLILRHLERPACRQDGPSTAVMEAAGYYERGCAQEELYDLYLDPWERHNCAQDPGYAETLEDLRTRLHAELRASNDPFLSGEFPQKGPMA